MTSRPEAQKKVVELQPLIFPFFLGDSHRALRRDRFWRLTFPLSLVHKVVLQWCTFPITSKHFSISSETRLEPLSVLKPTGTPYRAKWLSKHLMTAALVVEQSTSTPSMLKNNRPPQSTAISCQALSKPLSALLFGFFIYPWPPDF